MVFVVRSNGKIVGEYGGFNAGIAEEELPEDHPEVVAFRNPPPPPPVSISRRQFYAGLERIGKITKADALAAMKTGKIPAALQAIIDAMPDADAKYEVEMALVGATEFLRSSEFVPIFATAEQMSDAEVDDFWRLCYAL